MPDLIHLLDATGIDRAYAGYNTAYPIVFLTGERIIVSAAAGPDITERYPPYEAAVRSAERCAVILPSGSEAEVSLLSRLDSPVVIGAGAYSFIISPANGEETYRLLRPGEETID